MEPAPSLSNGSADRLSRNGADGGVLPSIVQRVDADRFVPADRRVHITVPESNGGGDDEGGSIDLLGILWRRRGWVLSGLLIGLVVSGLALKQATPVYQSSSQLYVQQEGLRALNDGSRLYDPSENLATQAEVIRSTRILEEASRLPSMADPVRTAEPGAAVAMLKQTVFVKLDDKTDILEVSARSTSPLDASKIVNGVVDAYLAFQAKTKKRTAADVLAILQKEKQAREDEVDAIFNKMIAFKRDKGSAAQDVGMITGSPGGVGMAGGNGGTVSTRGAEILNALTAVQLERMDFELMAKAVAAANGDEGRIQQLMRTQPAAMRAGGGSTGQSNADLWQQLRASEMELIKLRGQLGEDHERIRALDRSVQVAREVLINLERGEVQLFQVELAIRQEWLRQKEADLQARYDAEQKLLLARGVDGMEFTKLQSELRRSEQMCDILDSRIKELNVNEETGGFNINVLEVAKPAGRPVSPIPAKYLAIGVVFGLMAGVGAGLVRDWTDPRLRSVGDIRSAVDTPVLGVVPRIRNQTRNERHGLEVFKAPRSKVAEAYKTIRTAVYFESPTAAPKTLLVTSPSPGDGKTTLASNLAIAMAQAGRRILLVDADCRRPMQHKVFGLAPEVGLSDVLKGKAEPEAAVLHTMVERLDLLPCGKVPENPSELLGSQRFDAVLAWAAERYDMVMIDSPPVVPVTDARILSARCDLTLLVVRANKTSRTVAGHANELLVRVGANLLGVVVNDVDVSRGGYGYGYYYDYNYDSHRNDDADAEHAASNGKRLGTESAA